MKKLKKKTPQFSLNVLYKKIIYSLIIFIDQKLSKPTSMVAIYNYVPFFFKRWAGALGILWKNLWRSDEFWGRTRNNPQEDCNCFTSHWTKYCCCFFSYHINHWTSCLTAKGNPATKTSRHSAIKLVVLPPKTPPKKQIVVATIAKPMVKPPVLVVVPQPIFISCPNGEKCCSAYFDKCNLHTNEQMQVIKKNIGMLRLTQCDFDGNCFRFKDGICPFYHPKMTSSTGPPWGFHSENSREFLSLQTR